MPEPAEEFAPASEPTRRTKLLKSVEQQVKFGKLVLGAACALVLAGAGAVSYVGTLAKAAEMQATVRRVDRLEEERRSDHEALGEVRSSMHQVLDQVLELSRFLRAPIVNQSHDVEQVVPAPRK